MADAQLAATRKEVELIAFYLVLGMRQSKCDENAQIQLLIMHRYASLPGRCTPGEEIAAAFLIHKGKEYWIPLSITHLILLDYLARHQQVPQTATQIAMGLANELFYVHHASNSRGGGVIRSRTSRLAVKQQIMRLRKSLARCFRVAQIMIDPSSVVRSEQTSTNEVVYCLEARMRWEHVSL